MRATIILILLTLCASAHGYGQARADAIKGLWLSEDKRCKAEIYEKNGKYHGKITWLYEQVDPDTGKPKLDKNNPDPAKQGRQLIGLHVLRDFVYREGFWQDGYVYNPRTGKTYTCEVWLEGKDVLVLRGYRGIIYHTEKWTRVH